MRSREFPVVLLLAFFVLLWSLAAGCGGEEGSPEQTSAPDNGDTAAETAQQQETAEEQTVLDESAAAGDGDRPRIMVALGTIESVDPATRNLELNQVEGGPMAFRILPDARIAVDEQAAGLADLKVGQQAQIRYVAGDERNRARTVKAFSDGG